MNRTIEDLQCGGLVIVQDKDLYRFTSDSVLLANFFKAKAGETVVELCSGSSVISILGTKKTRAKQFYCFELQKEMCELAEESIKLNNIKNISVIEADLSDAYKILNRKVDVVVVNPPYYQTGKPSDNPVVAKATHELSTNLAKIAKSAGELLKFGGKLFMVHLAERFADVCYQLIANDIQPKQAVFVYPTKDKQPNVVLIEAIKNGKSGIKIKNITQKGEHNYATI
ncbi:MAG: methyltransferase [Clostridia bacterium]|nr:methyltransferase [Clostridia bacterium]